MIQSNLQKPTRLDFKMEYSIIATKEDIWNIVSYGTSFT